MSLFFFYRTKATTCLLPVGAAGCRSQSFQDGKYFLCSALVNTMPVIKVLQQQFTTLGRHLTIKSHNQNHHRAIPVLCSEPPRWYLPLPSFGKPAKHSRVDHYIGSSGDGSSAASGTMVWEGAPEDSQSNEARGYAARSPFSGARSSILT